MRVPIALEKALQPQHIAILRASDDHGATGSAPQQTHAAQNQGAHDPFAEFRLLDKELAQP